MSKDKIEQFNIRLPADLIIKVKHTAVSMKCHNGEVVRLALEQYFKGKKVPSESA